MKIKNVQGWAKEWALGCVNPASWFPLAAGVEFTQPRVHLLLSADPCTNVPSYYDILKMNPFPTNMMKIEKFKETNL